MRTEAEIRKHRDDLQLLVNQPCSCAGTRHEFTCICGGKMMEAAIRELSWALGSTDSDEAVAHLGREADAIRRSN